MPADPSNPSVWPHRVAVLLACATFPLVWVGGLVTTYRAGMAVPDWPSTYGYNLFLYPWQTWLLGPWDLFIEHGHRLLGAVAGLLAIALVATTLAADSRRWLRWLVVAALVLVIVQGLLGGGRVLLDHRMLALVHGCVGPAFFALTAALCVLTSSWWRSAPRHASQHARGWQTYATLVALLAYVQLGLGAVVRHAPEMQAAAAFRSAVPLHVGSGLLLAVLILGLAATAWRRFAELPALTRPSSLLALLVLAQVALGGATWIVNYGWPGWFAQYGWAQGYVIQRESFVQAHITTAHVATGSLIVATSVVTALRSWRVLRFPGWQGQGRLLSAGVLA
jgi:cytochrome c oxidase assembly protein subunit 15